jgi:hypothetical protein
MCSDQDDVDAAGEWLAVVKCLAVSLIQVPNTPWANVPQLFML